MKQYDLFTDRHVLLLSINYAPEPTGFAPHVTALCEFLVRAGCAVTVFTGFPFAPRWVRWPEYSKGYMQKEDVNSVSVVRLTHFIPRSPSRLIERCLMEGTFCLSALIGLIRYRPRFDGVIYVGAQPSIAFLARGLAWLKNVRYGIFINDLATGAAADVGIIKHAWLQRLLHAFEYAAYRKASHAVVLCQAFKDALVADAFPEGRISIVRSPVNLEQIRPLPTNQGFRVLHGLGPDDFVVLFAGSMGLKQGMGNVIAAARLLTPSCPRIKWILVGEGETRTQIEKSIQESELCETVFLLPFQPAAQMSAMFSAADVLLLNQLKSVKNTVVPSKLLTYMAAGRPVLAAVNAASQGAEIMREAQGGIVVLPEDPEALAEGVLELANLSSLGLSAMGQANRRYALEHFDESKILRHLERFVSDVMEDPIEAKGSAA